MSHTIDGSGNFQSFPDIHGQMDGKLIRYSISPHFSVDDKRRLIYGLIEIVRERANPTIRDFGIQGLNLIARDVQTAANWQGADGFYVDDVLAEICSMLVNVTDIEIVDTIINTLAEQMADMIRTNGTCPSGRLRVFQCFMILKDYFDKAHMPAKNANE